MNTIQDLHDLLAKEGHHEDAHTCPLCETLQRMARAVAVLEMHGNARRREHFGEDTTLSPVEIDKEAERFCKVWDHLPPGEYKGQVTRMIERWPGYRLEVALASDDVSSADVQRRGFPIVVLVPK